ncbi:XXT2, partial [Symbiodinium sp. CCMP2592]
AQVSQPRSRVVVASLFAGSEFAQTMLPARRNHERWCALHGYTYACLEENIAGRADPTWSKLPHVLELLKKGAEFVFWMDADSLFISDGVDLQWACDLGKDFVFAGDLNVVFNAGHFLARRGAWAERFLSDAFRIHPWPDWEDNGAMMILLGGGSADEPSSWRTAFERMKVPTRSPGECHRAMTQLLPRSVAEHVQVVPQHLLNAYEWPRGGGDLSLLRGDPILHFAGCSAEQKTQLIAKFAPCTGDPLLLLHAKSLPA